MEAAKNMKCNADDVADSVCLAVVANLLMQGKTERIPDYTHDGKAAAADRMWKVSATAGLFYIYNRFSNM